MDGCNLMSLEESETRAAVRAVSGRYGDPLAATVAQVRAWRWHGPSATLSGETPARVRVAVQLGAPVPPFGGRPLAIDVEGANGATSTGAITVAPGDLRFRGASDLISRLRTALDRRAPEPEGAA